jgi:hypothetical protein
MIVGALRDTNQLEGTGDVKADLHVRRVLGWVLTGNGPLSAAGATAVARELHPANPWLLDTPLYWLGRDVCTAADPDCDNCYLQEICQYYHRTSHTSSAALLDAVDGVAAGATGMAPDEAPPDFFEAYAAVQAALSDGVMAVASAHIEGWADDAEAAGWSGPAARRPAARASPDDPPG